MLALLKQYLNLAKPGIVFGNLISVTGGFFLASRGDANLALYLATALGVSLVIASGCVFNNYIDRDIDQKMERTRNRVLAQGLVSPVHAIVYACVLGVAGVALLYAATNTLAVMLVLMGFVVYVGLYSLWLKRGSVYGTLVGSLSGAAPPVVGYCAVSNEFDAGAAILLLIFSLWQMPHSYAIAIFRFNDYQAANIPVLPVIKGISAAKRQIVLYIAAFVVATLMLTLSGYAGYSYFVVAALSGAYWLWMGVSGYKAVDDRVWARKLFTFSIISITMLSVMMSVDFISSPEQVLVTSINHLWSQFAGNTQGICAVVAGI
ncbi:heme o synthase [Ectopseudomonas toyotomiensis]|uniref:Protoheme IX farnesyltransferase n=1 Tax=Ectopseudomonas toyotomiensis TaxID=554344 RepID=A0AA42IPD8_9GAMM|nr:heme o synthase [Pseudomonas toyotomiensis]MBG0838712.1 protoheme IX farnesyltransferase [Pseudomonas toyotomiensis]MDH0700214.1 heme o synthase [Pseudomonas toyotomiensis]